MPRRPEPFYDEVTNAWRLRFKRVMSDGKVRRYWHLCSGKHNYARALTRAGQILGPCPDPVTVNTIVEAIKAFLARHPGDYRRRMLAPLSAYRGAMALSDLPAGFLENYRDHLKSASWQDINGRQRVGYSKKSIRGYVGYANTLFKWCAHRDRRYLESIPDMPDLPAAPKGHRAVPKARLRAAFEQLPRQAGAILRFILEVGCRPDEACRLQWEQIDLEDGTCTIADTDHKTGAKTGDDRVLFMTENAKLLVRNQPRDSKWVFPSRLKKPYTPAGLRKILSRRGIRGAYQLRHTWAQNALDQGVDLATIGLCMGHKSVKTTEIYARVRRESARQAARSLSSPLLPPPSGSSDPANESAAVKKPARGTRQANRAG